MNRNVIDERITIKPAIPHTAIYLLMPVEGMGTVVFLAYVAFHWTDFLVSSDSIVHWVIWFGGLALYAGLGWFVVQKIIRPFLDGLVSFGQGIAEIHQKVVETRNISARRQLLHTEANYAAFLRNGQVVIESPRQERYNYTIKETARSDQDALPSGERLALPPGALPTNVTYEAISDRVPAGHALLGVSSSGVETCDFSQLMTMWICGGSNTGKSNTVGIKIEEAIRNGRNLKIICIDYHARKSDSLYNKIKEYESRFLCPVASDEEAALKVLRFFLTEFTRRREAGTGEQDILLVIDEVPAVLDSDNEEITKLLKRIARICGRESRGFGMFGWFISQNAVGLAWLRNTVLTVIAHKMNMLNEALLASNQHQDIARDMENWPRGRVVVYGLNFQGIKVLQMPLMTQSPEPGYVASEALTASGEEGEFDDLETGGNTTETNGDAGLIYLVRDTDELPVTSTEKKSQAVETGVKETIRRMKEAGMKDRVISKMVGLSGRKYRLYQEVLTELGYVQTPEAEEA